MNNEDVVKVIIRYEELKLLSEEQRQKILNIDSEKVKFLVSIKNEVYEKLNDDEKKTLEGFERTEIEPLRQEIKAVNMVFKLLPKIELKENIQLSFRQKHKKQIKPYCPKKIYNKNYDSKKKGCR